MGVIIANLSQCEFSPKIEPHQFDELRQFKSLQNSHRIHESRLWKLVLQTIRPRLGQKEFSKGIFGSIVSVNLLNY